jgi:pimeloyl-ACP methyl ester carboxylesterase
MQTWLLLRGLTRENRHWGDFLGQLQLTLPTDQIIALDLPGNGRLNHQRSPLRIQDMVALCRAQLAFQNIAPPYNMLAMSMGAMVAVAWSEKYPQEVAAQVLINTSMRPFSPFYHRLLPANYTRLLKLSLIGAAPEAWEHAVLQLTSNRSGDNHDDAQHDNILPLWLAYRLENPVSRSNAVRQLIAAARFQAPLVKPPVPTLLLTSEQDHLVSANCSKTLASYWQCELRVHDRAGHDLPLDDGTWVIAQLRAWNAKKHEIEF